MALDGIVISNIVHELNSLLCGGRISKVYQPEADEIVITVRSSGSNYKLLLCASPSHPRAHITSISKDNPQAAPAFCMIMRKHLTGGKILAFEQPNFERIINLHFESLNEMGDLTAKKLIIEIMGKHSNIILTDANDRIIDSVKRVSHERSSVREVLPGKHYVLPLSQGKQNPLMPNRETFLTNGDTTVIKSIYLSYTGISPTVSDELCHRAGVDPDMHLSELPNEQKERLYEQFYTLMRQIADKQYCPEVIMARDNSKVEEFSAVELSAFSNNPKRRFDSISELLDFYYRSKDSTMRQQQKSSDLRKLVSVNIERCVKKKDIQRKTLKDVEPMDKWRLYGDLITANIHSIRLGDKRLTTINYYDEAMPEIKIPLDESLTPPENAQRFYAKYNKAKRTLVALDAQIKQNNEELEYLQSVLATLETAVDEGSLAEVRDELYEQGISKKRRQVKGQKPRKSKPMHFKSCDGFDMYVGKNNKQNDELTLKFAGNSDYWLHTKEIPGSHVIVKSGGNIVPETTLNEAAYLAAFFSKAKDSAHVPVDYTLRKNVKKPNGAKPGMVIYVDYKTAYVTPSQERIDEITRNEE